MIQLIAIIIAAIEHAPAQKPRKKQFQVILISPLFFRAILTHAMRYSYYALFVRVFCCHAYPMAAPNPPSTTPRTNYDQTVIFLRIVFFAVRVYAFGCFGKGCCYHIPSPA
jgi:hypothetical protein